MLQMETISSISKDDEVSSDVHTLWGRTEFVTRRTWTKLLSLFPTIILNVLLPMILHKIFYMENLEYSV